MSSYLSVVDDAIDGDVLCNQGVLLQLLNIFHPEAIIDSISATIGNANSSSCPNERAVRPPPVPDTGCDNAFVHFTRAVCPLNHSHSPVLKRCYSFQWDTDSTYNGYKQIAHIL